MPKKRPVRYAWLTIKDDIQDRIYDGKLRPGDRVSTVAALAKRYGVSTTTVRQAINELALEGVLEIRQGRGTIVAPPKLYYDPIKGFNEQAHRLGEEPRTEIYLTQWSVPRSATARTLNLRPNQKVWEVLRIRYLDDEPVMLEVTEFLRSMAARFMGETRKLIDLFRTLREEFGNDGFDVNVTSVNVTRERAFSDILGIGHRTMFFHIARVVSVEKRPILVSFLVLRSDRFQLSFSTSRDGGNPSRQQLSISRKGGDLRLET